MSLLSIHLELFVLRAKHSKHRMTCRSLTGHHIHVGRYIIWVMT